MHIQVCGPGCAKCDEVEKRVRQVAATMSGSMTIEKVTDFNAISQLGVFTTPALVVDGAVRCVGRVPTMEEITAWLSDQ